MFWSLGELVFPWALFILSNMLRKRWSVLVTEQNFIFGFYCVILFNDIHLMRKSNTAKLFQSGLCTTDASVRSVQFSRSVVSNSLQPHESQHARPSCPSPTPRVHSDSRPLSQWCHPAISSSVAPFSSCPQSLPSSQSFPMSQLFAWGGQSTGV